MNPELKLTITIPTLGEATELPHLLKSLESQQVEFAFEVFLVDNSLNEKTFSWLQSLVKSTKLNIEVIKSEKKGVNYARNMGIHKSSAELLMFIDDDCWLNDKFLLAKHVRFHQQNPELFAVGGHYSIGESANYLDHCYHEIQMNWLQSGVIDVKTNQTRYLIGGHCSVKKKQLLTHGLRFDDYIKYGGSELSLFLKAFALNLPMKLENVSLVHVPNLSLTSLVRKLYKQGQGKAYLQDDFVSNKSPTTDFSYAPTLENEKSLGNKVFVYVLNLFFWFGYYQKSQKPFSIFTHVARDLTGTFQHKRYQALAKIDQQLQEKKDRGDRL